ncbi:MAG: hypothetical protein LDL12_06470 [Anaerolinea sp.]|nr:hypothetical protein [Anaerolinea sp.]
MISDRSRTCLSAFFAGATLILPLVALAIGWLGWNFRTGAIAGLITFVVLFLVSGVLLATVRVPSWWTVFAPAVLGLFYTMLPDFIPSALDDAAVFTAGVLLSFTLWMRKQPETPRWVIIPMLAASLYALIGGFLPGPVDEMFVGLVGLGAAYYYGYRLPQQGTPSADDRSPAAPAQTNMPIPPTEVTPQPPAAPASQANTAEPPLPPQQ